jgi:hypothetical protein
MLGPVSYSLIKNIGLFIYLFACNTEKLFNCNTYKIMQERSFYMLTKQYLKNRLYNTYISLRT